MEKKESFKNMNIYEKLLAIGKMCGVLRKDKEGYGYKYVEENSIQAVLTAGLQKYGVLLIHNITPGTLTITPHSYEKYDVKIKGMKTVTEFIVSAEATYKWINVDNPTEFLEGTYIITGMQEDVSQAFGSAETYCNRYYLLKMLQIATTEDDPDNWRSKQRAAADQEKRELEREQQEALKAKIQEVINLGTHLIKNGVSKEDMLKVIGDNNEGNKNPSSIKSIEQCEVVLEALNKKFSKTKEKNDKE